MSGRFTAFLTLSSHVSASSSESTVGAGVREELHSVALTLSTVGRLLRVTEAAS